MTVHYATAIIFLINIWATSWENLFKPYANNKGADQPAHPRSLISPIVVRCLDIIISLSFYSHNFMPLSCFCSWAGRFESYLVVNSEDRFSRDVAHFIVFRHYRNVQQWQWSSALSVRPHTWSTATWTRGDNSLHSGSLSHRRQCVGEQLSYVYW